MTFEDCINSVDQNEPAAKGTLSEQYLPYREHGI